MRILKAVLLSVITFTLAKAHADEALLPYVLAYSVKGDAVAETNKVRGKLTAAGFTVVGSYLPYAGATVLAVTSEAMRQTASKDRTGGFGAVEHVAITEADGSLQVSYLNPAYLYAANRMAANPDVLTASLKATLGAEKAFGASKGLTPKQLINYNYMMGMEHFDDFYKLGKHKSYQEAVKAVEGNLVKGVAGTAMVYKVELPVVQQTVFGVSFADVGNKNANDKHMMFDTVEPNYALKTTAYLPYQIVVSGNEVLAQHMRFRMAVWHPELTMGTFGKLMSSPGAIEEVLTEVAGGKKEASRF